MKLTVNLEEEMIRENRKAIAAQEAVIQMQKAMELETDKLVNAQLEKADQSYKADLMKEFGFDYKLREASEAMAEKARLAHLPQERIFTKDTIKSVCERYALRFLPTKFYKGSLDEAIGAKLEEFKRLDAPRIERLKKEKAEKAKRAQELFTPSSLSQLKTGNISHQIGGQYGPGQLLQSQQQLENVRLTYLANQQAWPMYLALNTFGSGASSRDTTSDETATYRYLIAAPKESFALQPRPKDPLLFVDLGNDKFYLIHKWGNDLSVWRRIRVWLGSNLACFSQVDRGRWDSEYLDR